MRNGDANDKTREQQLIGVYCLQKLLRRVNFYFPLGDMACTITEGYL